MGLKIGAATIENSMEFPQKTKTNISFRNSTAEYILKENENTHSKRDMHPDVHIYIHNGILLRHKKEWNYAICNSVVGPRGYYAQWNKSDKEKSVFIYMQNLKQMYMTKKEIDSQI